MEFNVLIGGEGGQGAFSVELELTEILTRPRAERSGRSSGFR